MASRRLPGTHLQSNSEARVRRWEGGSQGGFLQLHMNRQAAGVRRGGPSGLQCLPAADGRLWSSGPHPFWHDGPVSWKTIFFPWTRVGGWFGDDSSTLQLLCALLLLLLHRSQLRSSGIRSWRLGTPASDTGPPSIGNECESPQTDRPLGLRGEGGQPGVGEPRFPANLPLSNTWFHQAWHEWVLMPLFNTC